MILQESLLLAKGEVMMGVPRAMLVGHALTSSLYGVKPLDMVCYLLALKVVAVVALLASVVPAGRAASRPYKSAARGIEDS
jgi:hypothetical protein